MLFPAIPVRWWFLFPARCQAALLQPSGASSIFTLTCGAVLWWFLVVKASWGGRATSMEWDRRDSPEGWRWGCVMVGVSVDG